MIKQFIKDIKGISWIKPKTLVRRFFLSLIFITILTLIAEAIQIFGGALFKFIGA